MYKVQVRRTSTEYGWVYIEADSPEEALDDLVDNLKQGFAGRFDAEELTEEQYDIVEGVAPMPIE